ncbi:protein of unknown function [Methylacidimicrobium sp. AP8]|uniref:hypothetical protein n=1 Tax=Methylacidimicrobium sp. AP8 TaxID=2730359 RepID=UPI0018C06139|nr:hypothetical protein [Methylacidimicrobium sp. AP8]CAB4242522.1 protein of unknown function [Methylacidimicrobium sp. AP8]
MAARSGKEIRERRIQELVAACDRQRAELGAALDELRTPVHMLELGWRLAQVVRPGVQLFRELRDIWVLRTPSKTRSSLLSAWRLLSWAERARLAWTIGRWAGDFLLGRGRRRA